MKVAIVTGPTSTEARRVIAEANRRGWGVEIRSDLFKSTVCDILSLKGSYTGPCILTWKESHKGHLLDLLALEPDYLDLDHSTDPALAEEIRSQFPNIQIICSYHNFTMMPYNLDGLLSKMQSQFRADTYKICVTPYDIQDCYKMLKFIQTTTQRGISLIGICRGKLGAITRTEGDKLGNVFDYQVLSRRAQRAKMPVFS